MPESPPKAAWTADTLADPHHVADKRARVQRMFAAIAPRYDLNNRLHSFWRDQAWRRAAVRLADLKSSDTVVDIACGTGDLTLEFLSALSWAAYRSCDPVKPNQVVGVDFTFDMLPIAARKAEKRFGDNEEDDGDGDDLRNAIIFLNGDAQQLPLPDACCDVVSIAFGIRNVQNVPAAMGEFYRVLRPGGRLIVLEFSEPRNRLLRAMNRFNTGRVMPLTATLVSGDKSGAYKYLPKSVETFLTREQMTATIAAAGFAGVTQHPMTFGVCVCYRATKLPAGIERTETPAVV
jgi:demethylmenaquinone methyltransferase/2-methoxy-6-polyprenyl-1,4-benzoquinol methylase